ncbi:MAG TPA: pyruvate dehydrogenase (acetyl-transferring), homodimeric type, partial [Burkholderiaceae bacterium]
FSELEREAREIERWNRLHPGEPPRTGHAARSLGGSVPVVAASDSVRAWPQLIAPHLPLTGGARFAALGTDGFGRSDTRDALRRFFEVDRYQVVLAALDALAAQSVLDRSVCAQAITRYALDVEAPPPWSI